jgi:hypothetical protein
MTVTLPQRLAEGWPQPHPLLTLQVLATPR